MIRTFLNNLLVEIYQFNFNKVYRKDKKEYDKYFKESLDAIRLRYNSRDEIYRFMNYLFNFSLNTELKDHRLYFSKQSRGFGEDALHAMWWILFKEFKPKSCLEIGVYRGQVISLWALLAKLNNDSISISGVSPFSSSGDEVSEYLKGLNYYEDVKHNFKLFSNQNPTLFQGFSNENKSIEFIENGRWDLIYIDGSHDYDVALSDYNICKNALSKGGLLVLDDSSLYTDYHPPQFGFAGHPGPSKIVIENAMNEMDFVIGVGHNNVFKKR